MKKIKIILTIIACYFTFQAPTKASQSGHITDDPTEFYLKTGIHNSNLYNLITADSSVLTIFRNPIYYCKQNKMSLNEWKDLACHMLGIDCGGVFLNENVIYDSEFSAYFLSYKHSAFGNVLKSKGKWKTFLENVINLDEEFHKILSLIYPNMGRAEHYKLQITTQLDDKAILVNQEFDVMNQVRGEMGEGVNTLFRPIEFFKFQSKLTEVFGGLSNPHYSILQNQMLKFHESLHSYSESNIYHIAIEQTALLSRILKDAGMKNYKVGKRDLPLFLAHYKRHQYGFLGSMYMIHQKLTEAIFASPLGDKTINFYKKHEMAFPLLILLRENDLTTDYTPFIKLNKIALSDENLTPDYRFFPNRDATSMNPVEKPKIDNMYDFMKEKYPFEEGKAESVHHLLKGYTAFTAYLNAIYFLEHDEDYAETKEVYIDIPYQYTENNTASKSEAKSSYILPDDFMTAFYIDTDMKKVFSNNGIRKTSKNNLNKFFKKIEPEDQNRLHDLVSAFDATKNNKALFIEFVHHMKTLGCNLYDAVTFSDEMDLNPPHSLTKKAETKNSQKKKRRKNQSTALSQTTRKPENKKHSHQKKMGSFQEETRIKEDSKTSSQTKKTAKKITILKNEARNTSNPQTTDSKKSGILLSDIKLLPLQKKKREKDTSTSKPTQQIMVSKTYSFREIAMPTQSKPSEKTQTVRRPYTIKHNKINVMKRKRHQTERLKPSTQQHPLINTEDEGNLSTNSNRTIVMDGNKKEELDDIQNKIQNNLDSEIKYLQTKARKAERKKKKENFNSENSDISTQDYIKQLERENERLKRTAITENDVKSLQGNIDDYRQLINVLNEENQTIHDQMHQLGTQYTKAFATLASIIQKPEYLRIPAPDDHEHNSEGLCYYTHCKQFVLYDELLYMLALNTQKTKQ